MIFSNELEFLTKNGRFKLFWKGATGKTHFTPIFDSETNSIVFKIWDTINYSGKKISEVREESGLNMNTLSKIVSLLHKHSLIEIIEPLYL